MECDGLAKADVLGKSDPYCVLSTGGGSSYRTKTKRMTLNPQWRGGRDGTRPTHPTVTRDKPPPLPPPPLPPPPP